MMEGEAGAVPGPMSAAASQVRLGGGSPVPERPAATFPAVAIPLALRFSNLAKGTAKSEEVTNLDLESRLFLPPWREEVK